jgi:integrase
MKRRKTPYPPYTHNYRDRHGKLHSVFRRGTMSVPLPYPHLTTEYWEAYRAVLAAWADGKAADARSTIGARHTIPRSFKAGCIAYFENSVQFNNRLAPSTQRQWRAILERLCEAHGDKPLRLLKRMHIEKIIAAKATTHPGAAHTMLKVLRQVCRFWLSIELIDRDPTAGIPNVELAGDGFHTWTAQEEARFEEFYPVGTPPRLCLELLRWLGLRIGDIAALGPQHIAGSDIVIRQQKTRDTIRLPIAPELASVIAATPCGDLSFLTDRNGKAYLPRSLSAAFIRWCHAAALPECSAHGVRKAVGTAIADAGGSTAQGAAVLGHRSLGMVDRYSKQRDQAALAREGIALLRAQRANKIG